jgi:hypothetical protein
VSYSKKTMVMGVLLCASMGSLADGICTNCTVKSIGVGPYYDGLCTSGTCAFVAVNGTVNYRPTCSNNTSWHFVLDTSTASGRATYALLLSAKASSASLNVYGTANCTLTPAGATETLSAVYHAE